MSDANAAKAPHTDSSRRRSRLWSNWLPVLLALLAFLLVGLLVWAVPVGRTVISGTDRRNQTDLAIAAAGLEQWSAAVAGLARANFINGLAVKLPDSERDYSDGWRYRSWLRHPALDEFKITYVVTSDEQCQKIARGIEAREGMLPFVANFNDGNAGFLKIVDSFPLQQLRNDDQRTAGTADNSAYLKTIDAAAGPVKADDVVCFSAGIPIDRLLSIDKAARGFSNLLIIDARDRVAVQIGADRLPVKSLAGMVPETSVLARTLAVSTGQNATATPPAPRVADSLKPVDIDIGGRSYIAYIRPLSPPPSFNACRPPPAPGQGQTVVTTTGTTANTVTLTPGTGNSDPGPASAKPPANACLLVAFMPRATLLRQVVDFPLVVLVLVGIGVVAFIALVPSLRLVLLGPGEAIGRAEAIGVALGLPAVASMLTLALLLAVDVGRHRAAADDRADVIVESAARAAAGQVRKAVAMVDLAGRAPSAAAFPPVVPTLDGIAGPETVPARQWPRPKPRPGLDADPKPQTWPAGFCRDWGTSGLPVINSAGLIDEDGRQLAGSRTVACRDYFGGRTNVSARNYFLRLRNGHPSLMDGTSPLPGSNKPYVIAQVSALQDGVSKTVIAMKTGLADTDATHREQGRTGVYVVGTATLTTVIAPVLPPGFNLMIVDTRDDALPVLLHTTPGRSGTERLSAMVRNPDGVREQLRRLHLPATAPGKPTEFQSYYDGADRHFVAAPISGTRWVAVVHYSVADIDRESADTALHTLRSWAAFSILFTLPWVAWLAWKGSRGWPRLWPQQALTTRYRPLMWRFIMLAAVGMVLILAFGAMAPAAALLTGLLARLLAAVDLHATLGKPGKPNSERPLCPETEQRYKLMLIALIACLSVVPMLGFWREAHEHTAEEYRTASFAALTGADGALESNRRMVERLRWAYGFDPRPARSAGPIRDPGRYGVALHPSATPPAPPTATGDDAVSAVLDSAMGRAALPRVADCEPPTPTSGTAAEASANEIALCVNAAGGTPAGIAMPSPGWWPGLWTVTLIGLAAIAAALTFNWLLDRVLRSLAGFGVPLEAFAPPVLFVGDLWRKPVPATIADRQVVTLNRKSLLVNAPYIILPILRKGGVRLKTINVADMQVAAEPMVEGMVMVVTGIELVLADRDRRLRALHLLEQQCTALARLGVDTGSRLLILSEAAPLERILDAFERDEARTTVDADRENLRWSRLFEDFATYNFRQSQLTGSSKLPALIDAAAPEADQRSIIAAACAELRWLPQRVAGGAIGRELRLPDDVLGEAIVPIPDQKFQDCFEEPIVTWAAKRAFTSKAAVWSHVRNQCIEYYQKLWSSSTHAEHLVMHNLATGRFVNIGTALAFAALVRRGIIIFDPEPRLMNQSFAMFVRQAEKLDTIKLWKSDLPKGAWVMARLPIFALISVLVAGLAAAVALSGEDITSMLPVLAAGIPALIAATQRLFNRG